MDDDLEPQEDNNMFDNMNFESTISWAMICGEIELREEGKVDKYYLTDAELRDRMRRFERDSKEVIRIMLGYARHRLREATPDPTCQHCCEEFDPVRSDAKYCSPKCRVAAHRKARK